MKTIEVDRNQPYGCVTVHSISSLDHLDSELLFMRKLSCLCSTCVHGGEMKECDNIKLCRSSFVNVFFLRNGCDDCSSRKSFVISRLTL
jgi:hypothetical protein